MTEKGLDQEGSAALPPSPWWKRGNAHAHEQHPRAVPIPREESLCTEAEELQRTTYSGVPDQRPKTVSPGRDHDASDAPERAFHRAGSTGINHTGFFADVPSPPQTDPQGSDVGLVSGAQPLAVTARAARLAAPAERNSTTTSHTNATAATAVPVYPPPRT